MNLFPRKASLSGRGGAHLFRVLVASLTGSGLLYSYGSSSDSCSRISLAMPVSLGDVFSIGARIVQDHWMGSFLVSTGTDNSPVHWNAPANHCSGCLGRDSIANAAARISPAVVNICIGHEFFGLNAGKRTGSGTLIDSSGTILTCAHIVADTMVNTAASAKQVDVTLQDGRIFKGKVVGFDEHSDIAVVKIYSKTPLPAATIGSSNNLRPGDWVVAVGSPFSLQNTVTAGIISCVDRKSSDLGLTGSGMEYLQTDCAVNSGNSGGPLVNIDGEIVGINVFKALQADGMAFAVPIDYAIKILDHVKRSGRVIRPWLGLKLIDLNKTTISHLKDKDQSFPDVSHGVLVPVMTPASPAERAGFQLGDVIVEFDGKPVATTKEIVDIIGQRVGVPMKVVVKRSKNITATLIVTPEESYPNT